jgi:hypothetical protein
MASGDLHKSAVIIKLPIVFITIIHCWFVLLIPPDAINPTPPYLAYAVRPCAFNGLAMPKDPALYAKCRPCCSCRLSDRGSPDEALQAECRALNDVP